MYLSDFAVDELLLLSRINWEEVASQPATDKQKGRPVGGVGVEEVLGILIEEPGRICKKKPDDNDPVKASGELRRT